ncbi:prepilin-type N-terminal cleavage/methylation domain-containing protein [Candidatus Pantoea multigeneris]|uniref:Prepilin-type N-terminal cleavage/methylation domain-containing protein n=1 Tax=Candidatus Pantoea multigeneris TaxID=2608357 RepID=A0ABX0RFL4_9GAMM|nr:prepilin-type N-terminal cleavage/methylation domain-containing protein [Pantoea multigeneris]NIF23222.1 prepilin-type N-terminal cleavage/methylation domain-containing protein [Pantoea multigeneris]
MRSERGFSLPELLFALLLMALSVSALLGYHRALSQGFVQQRLQREAGQVAADRLLGHETAGWRSHVVTEPGYAPCRRETVTVSGGMQRESTLTWLRCSDP